MLPGELLQGKLTSLAFSRAREQECDRRHGHGPETPVVHPSPPSSPTSTGRQNYIK